ncbi:MAG: metal-sensing transcriptional repressor [Spirochaetales bacterium]|nr:metal-sensing transcriptional repressor [Spirochaetales bacterium]
MDCPCCNAEDNGRKTNRTEDQKRRLVNRLKRIEGQIRGIRNMIENDAYCNDVLIQSAAVGAAVDAFSKEVLSAHIHGCVARDIRAGKDEVIDELMQTMQKLMR